MGTGSGCCYRESRGSRDAVYGLATQEEGDNAPAPRGAKHPRTGSIALTRPPPTPATRQTQQSRNERTAMTKTQRPRPHLAHMVRPQGRPNSSARPLWYEPRGTVRPLIAPKPSHIAAGYDPTWPTWAASRRPTAAERWWPKALSDLRAINRAAQAQSGRRTARLLVEARLRQGRPAGPGTERQRGFDSVATHEPPPEPRRAGSSGRARSGLRGPDATRAPQRCTSTCKAMVT